MAGLKPFDGELDAAPTLQPFTGTLDGEKSGPIRRLADVGLGLAKGAVAVPEAAVGIADIASGGRAGQIAERFGFRPKDAKAVLSDVQSPELRGARQQFADADGVLDKAKVAITNPSLIVDTVAESVPSMLGGAAVARQALQAAPRIGAVGAGALGEGVVGAGSAAEQIRQETADGTLTPGQGALAAGSGAATGLLGLAGGKVAQKLGIGDVDTMLAQGSRQLAAAAPQKGIVRRAAEGAVSEGVLEELPQSVSEQVIQNVALDRPLSEGVADQAVLGTLAGGVMGGAAAAASRSSAPAPQPRAEDVDPTVGTSVSEGMAGTSPSQPAAPALKPSEAMGIDPAAGPLSRAAADAVDSGASAAIQAKAAADAAAAEAQKGEGRSGKSDEPQSQEAPAGQPMAAPAGPAVAAGTAPETQPIQSPPPAAPAVSVPTTPAGSLDPQAAVPDGSQGPLSSAPAAPRQDVPQSVRQDQPSPNGTGVAAEVEPASPPAPRGQFASAEDARAYIRQQRRNGGTRMDALPLPHDDGSFGVALRGTPDYTVAEFHEKQRVLRERGVIDGDILAKSGEPFKNRLAAGHALRQAGEGFAIHAVKDGFVIRKGAADVSEPGATGGLAAGAGRPAGGDDRAGLAAAGPAPDARAGRGADPSARAAPDGQQDLAARDAGGAADAVGLRPATLAESIEADANEAATSPTNDRPEPTDGQKEAGNYRKGHTKVHGLDVTIENPRGSTRSGKRPDGSTWSHQMSDHYGYIRRTVGADDEQVDVYVGPKPESDRVFVVDQINQQTGGFDEHKAMLGYDNQMQAMRAYRANFDKGWKVGPVRAMSVDEFKAWLKGGDTTKPAAQAVSQPQEQPRAEESPQAAAEAQSRQARGTEARADVPDAGQPAAAAPVEGVPEDGAAEAVAPAGERFPRVDSVKSVSVGPGGVRPRVIAEGKPLYRETNASGLDGILAMDRQFDVGQMYVADSQEIALGQGGNRGVHVVFRPDALSGKENAKPGTGDIAGREYVADVVAPRAVQAITFDSAEDIKKLRLNTRRTLAQEFDRQDLPDRRVHFTRKGLEPTPPRAAIEKPGLKRMRAARAARESKQAKPASKQPASAPEPPKTASEPAKSESPAKIDDFGEKLAGARKDYATVLKDAAAVDVSAEPLSKSWPEPDYQKLLDAGTPAQAVSMVRALRDEVATKPQSTWKLRAWVDRVKKLRAAAALQLENSDGQVVAPDFAGDVYGRAALYNAVGHARSLKGLTFAEHEYLMYKGENNVRKWVVQQAAKATAFSNWPRELVSADTREDALAQFKAKIGTLDLGAKAKGATSFDIYGRRGRDGVFIGKKIGRETIDLKSFPNVGAAREFLANNRAELEKLLERYKETPLERRADNAPRVGDDHRNGAPVTPEAFAQAFGFRGVQFGNYVEQGRRQSDLNEAYDGLMDLAAVLGVAPRALSLNGRLGLAFGARGRGGKNAPAAHYEPDTAVINLTKGGGPGSLAHEWWHSLDNYFAREAGASGYGTGGAKLDALREQMQSAFAEVRTATTLKSLRERSAELDKRRSSPYWNTPIELSARAFEAYTIAKLQDQGAANDYLANIVDEKVWNIAESARAEFFGGSDRPSYPYPTESEMTQVRAAFDRFFATVETRTDEAGNVAMFRRAEDGRTDERAESDRKMVEIEQMVDQVTAGWARKPEVIIARHVLDKRLPPEILDAMGGAFSQPTAGLPEGVYFRGKVYLIAQTIDNVERARTVLFHEALGHFGLRSVFGQSLKPILQQVATMRRAEVEAKIKSYGFDPRSEIDRLLAAEEVLAEMAQARPEIGFVQRAVAAIRAWLRAHGFTSLKLTDNDIIANYLLPARGFVERGRAADKAPSSSAPRPAFSLDTRSARAFLDSEPVATLRGDEFKPDGEPLTVKVPRWYREHGVERVDAPGIGVVQLDERAVKSSVGHGLSRAKASAFAAVPEVLQRGRIIHREPLAGARDAGEMVYVAAPVRIGDKDMVEVVLVKTDSQAKRMYVHEVAVREGLQQSAFKTGAGAAAKTGVPTGAEAGAIRSVLERIYGDKDAPADEPPAFSRSPTDFLKGVTATDLRARAGHTATDYRGLALQTLGRRQLVELYAKDLPQLTEYSKLVQQMDADKNEAGAGADAIAERWGKLPDEAALANLMHDATLAQMDPALDLVKGDDPLTHARLRKAYDALSPEARKIYAEARDTYRVHHENVRQAIRDRIERSDLRGPRKAELLKQMDDEFFKAIKGVYFPLARFGDYVVVVRGDDGQAISVSRAETMHEAQALRAELVKAYPKNEVGKVLKAKEFNAGRDMVGRGFMQELYGALAKKDMDEKQRGELEDMLGQLYLSALPDLSWAKHGIHRKGTAGFSQDARRAFAQNTFHGARYLAKIRYSDLLEAELTAMQKHVDSLARTPGYDSVRAQQVVDEMNKRHDAYMNPQANPLSTALTSLGFIFHLGLSPASAMVNLTQTALVAYPIMGARWGFTKASAALLKASQQAAANRNDISSSLSPEERRAFDEAVRSGVIDVTMAHDLAGISQGEDAKVSWKLRPVMKWASFLFHHAEKFNRQVTFVAAYRLAREAGTAPAAAYDQAVKATYDGHFDYSAGNRPRLMQGNVAKVVLLFKQYAQNMVYTLSRQAFLAMKGATPAERAEARKALGGLLALHASAAGVLGLPLVTTLLGIASMLGGSDDEPWDAEVALRNMLADAFGAGPADVLARGLSRATPWDISGRVGLDKLIFPDLQEGLEGQRLAESAMAAALGPVAGIGVNLLKGMQSAADGQWARGLEEMAPSVLRGPIKALRYGTEGAIDRTGKPIVEEVGALGVAGQALGFSPSEVRLATEAKSAIHQADDKLKKRRAALMRHYAMAVINEDGEGAADAKEAIQAFNEKNPDRRINAMQMAQSVRRRRMEIANSEQGVYLPKTRRDALEAGRFGVAE